MANVSEDDVADPSEMNMFKRYVNLLRADQAEVIVICAKIEEEIAELEGEEKQMFLARARN